MHSRVFQLETYPVADDERICAADMPDWFTNAIADYVADTSESERENEIGWMMRCLDNICRREGDKLIFKMSTEDYFTKKFAEFKSVLDQMKDVTIEHFMSDRRKPANGIDLDHLMWLLRNAYDETCAFYVWCDEEIRTMDEWVRSVEPAAVYYIGGIVDYHF